MEESNIIKQTAVEYSKLLNEGWQKFKPRN